MPETRYQIRELLGRGGTAEVYVGVDTRLGRPVAIKRLRGELAANPVLRTRFRREALAAARLNDPGIVAVLDTVELESRSGGAPSPVIVMELVEGPTLRAALRDGPLPSPDRALEIVDAILGALAASHQAGIVHRDIKPSNVLLTAGGQVKVADFGIARTLSDDSATLTQSATVLGTPHYMSPEQVRGLPVDHRSDLYAVGCVLYELLVGRPPFAGDTPLSIGFQHVAEPPPVPSATHPALPATLDTIVLRALQKSPQDRYQSAADMRADVAAARAGRPVQTAASPTPPDDEGTAPRAHHRSPVRATPRVSAAWALALVVLVLVLTGVAGIGYLRSSSPAATGATSTVGISTGPTTLTVPDRLLGATVSVARQRLQDAGFTNVTSREVRADDTGKPPGTVLAVDPAEGRAVPPETSITLSYTGDSSTADGTPTTEGSPGPTDPASPTASSPSPAATSRAGGTRSEPTSRAATKATSAKQKTADRAKAKTKTKKAAPGRADRPKKAHSTSRK